MHFDDKDRELQLNRKSTITRLLEGSLPYHLTGETSTGYSISSGEKRGTTSGYFAETKKNAKNRILVKVKDLPYYSAEELESSPASKPGITYNPENNFRLYKLFLEANTEDRAVLRKIIPNPTQCKKFIKLKSEWGEIGDDEILANFQEIYDQKALELREGHEVNITSRRRNDKARENFNKYCLYNELMAGAGKPSLLSLFLPKRIPQIHIITHEAEKGSESMLAVDIIDGFQELAARDRSEKHITLEGLEREIVARAILGDSDGHQGNIGYVAKDGKNEVMSIDPGLAFNMKYRNSDDFIKQFSREVNSWGKSYIDDFGLNFQEIIQAFKQASLVKDESIDSIIERNTHELTKHNIEPLKDEEIFINGHRGYENASNLSPLDTKDYLKNNVKLAGEVATKLELVSHLDIAQSEEFKKGGWQAFLEDKNDVVKYIIENGLTFDNGKNFHEFTKDKPALKKLFAGKIEDLAHIPRSSLPARSEGSLDPKISLGSKQSSRSR